MRAGKLRHRFQVLAYPEPAAADAYGDDTSRAAEPEVVATLWGELVAVGGREFQNADRTTAETTHQVKLRYFAGLKARNQLQSGGRTFEIESVVDPTGRRRELLVTVKEA